MVALGLGGRRSADRCGGCRRVCAGSVLNVRLSYARRRYVCRQYVIVFYARVPTAYCANGDAHAHRYTRADCHAGAYRYTRAHRYTAPTATPVPTATPAPPSVMISGKSSDDSNWTQLQALAFAKGISTNFVGSHESENFEQQLKSNEFDALLYLTYAGDDDGDNLLKSIHEFVSLRRFCRDSCG